jgi:hypothetical protein
MHLYDVSLAKLHCDQNNQSISQLLLINHLIKTFDTNNNLRLNLKLYSVFLEL